MNDYEAVLGMIQETTAPRGIDVAQAFMEHGEPASDLEPLEEAYSRVARDILDGLVDKMKFMKLRKKLSKGDQKVARAIYVALLTAIDPGQNPGMALTKLVHLIREQEGLTPEMIANQMSKIADLAGVSMRESDDSASGDELNEGKSPPEKWAAKLYTAMSNVDENPNQRRWKASKKRGPGTIDPEVARYMEKKGWLARENHPDGDRMTPRAPMPNSFQVELDSLYDQVIG